VDEADMLRTFNMGVGLTLVVPAAEVGDVVEHLQRCECEAYPIGRITGGSGQVQLVGNVRW
jgi:phosphoribosylformylglycinamidine cyclo-ligase